jgi:hypothetical protein
MTDGCYTDLTRLQPVFQSLAGVPKNRRFDTHTSNKNSPYYL